MEELVLRKDVPMPVDGRRRYDFAVLDEVGKCLEVGLYDSVQANSVRGAAISFAKNRKLSWKFKVGKFVENGVDKLGCWRVS